MRTFIALKFNRQLKNKLGEIQKELKKSSIKGRWVYIDNFHLTLKFLGEIHPAQVKKIESCLRFIANRNEKVNLSLTNLGIFPGKRDFRVVWLGVKGETNKLNNIHREVESYLNDIGFRRDNRQFRPHITLGRNIFLNKNFNEVKKQVGAFTNYNFTLDTIELMKSELIDGKRIYTPLVSFNLKDK
ncbi:RNA 2',3'-cyclic phosphodiesterase [Caldisalinibacter kiritimatiensis]|uniref:RNA 2',3'-cyclic phosphodiesterase n=1 Tax=Caldisalinibacter kiritimatiensis TaxID=1304284 RepID=R1CH95_9FIRM|nr:RNA 2',3'-cyclic phosphodiesterase [Caldisalinibacter kiritimatiensis]EOD01665.1 2'-5' RNA ligase [Caldisalinibacter kiritimatiensis]